MQPELYPLRLPSVVLLGCGAAAAIRGEAASLGAGRVLILCDSGVASSGALDEVRSHLGGPDFHVDVCPAVMPEPSDQSLDECVGHARARRPDVVVGLGGGSCMDVAKISAVLAVHQVNTEDMYGQDLVPGRGVPTILMPTTSGTGSEVTANAVVTDTSREAKRVMVSRHLVADAAVVDPLLTLSCPPEVSAAAGMDALAHAIESYLSVKATPNTRLYAIEAIRLCARSLRTAVLQGHNIGAREAMSRASVFAGISMSMAGTTIVHAMAYPIGAQFHVPHGLANAVLLPHALEFNFVADVGACSEIADAMGAPLDALSPRQRGEAAVRAVHELCLDVGIPTRLRDIGVIEESLASMASSVVATQQRLLANNPRNVRSSDILSIYRRAF